MEKLLSVIMPVYNAAGFISESLTRLLKTDETNVEFVIVNDGSSDETLSIIHEAVKHDRRFIVIDKQNGGVSTARNAGIEAASGKYFWFVDADDIIMNSAISEMCEIISYIDVDVVFFDAEYESKMSLLKGFFSDFDSEKDFTITENASKILLKNIMLSGDKNSVWNKIIRGRLIKENSVKFPEGVTNGEDGMFLMDCYDKANSFTYLKRNWYLYIIYQASASRRVRPSILFSNKSIYMKKIEYFEKYSMEKYVENYIRRDILYMNYHSLLYVEKLSRKEVIDYVKLLQEDEFINEEYKKAKKLGILLQVYKYLHLYFPAIILTAFIKSVGLFSRVLVKCKRLLLKY